MVPSEYIIDENDLSTSVRIPRLHFSDVKRRELCHALDIELFEVGAADEKKFDVKAENLESSVLNGSYISASNSTVHVPTATSCTEWTDLPLPDMSDMPLPDMVLDKETGKLTYTSQVEVNELRAFTSVTRAAETLLTLSTPNPGLPKLKYDSVAFDGSTGDLSTISSNATSTPGKPPMKVRKTHSGNVTVSF